MGDTVRLIGLYTKEANELASQILSSPMNYVDVNEGFMRGVSRECGLGWYMLTI